MATTSPARSRSSLARRRPWASGSGRCQLLTILLLAGLIASAHGHEHGRGKHGHVLEHNHRHFEDGPLQRYEELSLVHLERISSENQHPLYRRGSDGELEGAWNETWSHKVRQYHQDEARQQEATDHGQLRLSLHAYGQTFHFVLEPNTHLVHPEAYAHHQSTASDLSQRLQSMRHYKGHVQGDTAAADSDANWARFTFHESVPHIMDMGTTSPPPFEGVFAVNGEMYTVKLEDNYARSRRASDVPVALDKRSMPTNGTATTRVIIYRESDRAPANGTTAVADDMIGSCGADDLEYNGEPAKRAYEERLRKVMFDEWMQTGTNPLLSKRSAPGCPTATKILYMGVAADCSYVAHYGNADKALTQILSDWNQASRLFESTFNVALGIVSVSIQTECSVTGGSMKWNRGCSADYDISRRLSDFSQWRGTQNADAGLWHLMTKCNTGSTVGISWLNTACQTAVTSQLTDGQQEFVSGTGVSSVTPNEWLVVAHEIGHNFGAIHDCTADVCKSCKGSDCQCEPCSGCDCNGQYVMNPTSDVKTPSFSRGTIQAVCSKFPAIGTCLADPGTRTTVTGNQCGNGVKEPGEECDCGPANSPECINNACCDGSTCTLKPGARCDDRNDLCCKGCNFKPSGSVCRPSRGICDKEEKCSGADGICAKDEYEPDLATCTLNDGSGSGQCASGECTSRAAQCKLRGTLAGITGECPGYGSSCNLYCASSDAGECVQISGFYVDGTPCGYNGKCQAGTCSTANVVDGFFTWVQGNTTIAIVVFAVSGVILLYVLYACIVGLCCKRPKFTTDRFVQISGPPGRTPTVTSVPTTIQRRPSPERSRPPVTAMRQVPVVATTSRSALPSLPSPTRPSSTRALPSLPSQSPPTAARGASLNDPASTAPRRPSPTRLQRARNVPTVPQPQPAAPPLNWVDPASYNGRASMVGMQDGLRGVDAATLAAIHRSLEEERSAAGITTPQMAHVVPTRTVPVFGYPPDPHPRFGSQPPPYGP